MTNPQCIHIPDGSVVISGELFDQMLWAKQCLDANVADASRLRYGVQQCLNECSLEEIRSALKSLLSGCHAHEPPAHSTEDDFQHWLTYSGKRGQNEAELRLAYYAGADVPPPESGAMRGPLPGSPRALAESAQKLSEPTGRSIFSERLGNMHLTDGVHDATAVIESALKSTGEPT